MAILHLHSEFSKFDGAITPKALIKRLSEIGETTFALTDHGNLMGIDEFYAEVVEENKNREDGNKIRLIPGVEAYIARSEDERREHLVLLAKDYEGYRAIMQACTEAQKHQSASGQPTMLYPDLSLRFGSSSPAHSHVICLTACIAGPLGTELLHNYAIEKAMDKEMRAADRINFDADNFATLKLSIEEKQKQLELYNIEKTRLKLLAEKKYAKRIKQLAHPTIENQDEYDSLCAQLEAEMAESEGAKILLQELKIQISNLTKELTPLKAERDKLNTKYERYQKHINASAETRNNVRTEDEMYERAKARAEELVGIFGKDDTYLEVQYHGIEEETVAYPQIVEIAQETGLKLVATNDCHIIDGSDESRRKRQLLRSFRYNTWEEENVGDEELYVKNKSEMKCWLGKLLPEHIVDKAMAEADKIAEKCNVVFEENPEHYPKFPVPETFDATRYMTEGATRADAYLRYTTMQYVIKKYKRVGKNTYEGFTQEYKDRVNYELEVIKQLKVADYLLIVQDFLQYGRLLGKVDMTNPEYLANPYDKALLERLTKDEVGFAIGAGRGSAVGSLVCYIIGITDVDPIKYNLIFERFLNPARVTMPDIDSDFSDLIRDKVIEYVCHKYGENAVCGIMTKGTLAAKKAIKSCANVYSDYKYHDHKKLNALATRITDAIPKELNITLEQCYDTLVQEFGSDAEAMQIINYAKLVEGTFVSVGEHAAGVIIADNGDVREYVPLLIDNKGLWSSQTSAGYVEAKGLLKMDFLGLKNLKIITECIKKVKENYNIALDMTKIDRDDKNVFANIFQNGNTDDVFQFESEGMKNLLRKFKPENIEHLTLLNALYRPGPLQYADAICEAKNDPSKKPVYICDATRETLGVTYGYPVFQEQVMQLFNKAAGFSLGEADIIRRYMSKKKTSAFMAYKDKFVDGLVEHEAEREEAEALWEQLVEFSKYAFNKSHACAYAITAYYTAYLKYYYPKEYLSACLNDADFDDMPKTLNNLKLYNIAITQPSINKSLVGFTPLPNAISFGLGKIKGVAGAADIIVQERLTNGEYKSLEDYIERTNAKANTTQALICAGAFDEFCDNSGIYAYRKGLLAKIKAKQMPTTRVGFLQAEKDVVGVYISDNPVNGYVHKDKIANVVVDKKYNIVGVMSAVKVFKTKSNTTMASFVIDDGQDTIRCVAFPKTYSKFANYITDGTVIVCQGRVAVDGETLQMIVDGVDEPKARVKALAFYAPYEEYKDRIALYEKPNGVPLYINCGALAMETKVDITITKDSELADLVVPC